MRTQPGLLPEPLRSQRIAQIGIIVPDLKAALGTWSGLLGRDDWLVYTYAPENIPVLTYRSQPGAFSMRLAIAGDSPQVELIEPLTGPSAYHEWVERHGYGLHHLGFQVRSVAEGIERMRAQGIDMIQGGSGYGLDGDGAFAYFDTEPVVGVICELIELPAQRRPGERLE